MAKLLPAISVGQAAFIGVELRCQAERTDERHGDKVCNRLIAKLNRSGHIAGGFRCDRCKQEIEVRMVPAGPPDYSNRGGRYAQKRKFHAVPRLEEAQISNHEASSQ